MTDPKISELTVSQLQALIRQTVQEAVVDVMLEMSLHPPEADAVDEVEMMEYLNDILASAPAHLRLDD